MHASRNWAKVLTTMGPSLRWHTARAVSRAIYRHAFGALGEGSVVVAPRKIQGPENIRIGRSVAVYEGAWLAVEASSGGRLDIGDNTYLGHDCHIHAIDPISVGRNCVLADGVYIGSADHDRIDRKLAHGTGPIVVGDDVFIGQRAVVLGGVTIGDGATIGAHAVVTQDVAPKAVVAGVPARPLKGDE